MANLPLTSRLTQESRRTRKYRTLSAQFGDGYSQRAADGLNSIVDSWQIVYSTVTATEANTIRSFCDSVGNWDSFTWTAPGEASSKKWRIKSDVQESSVSGNLFSISFEIEQVFDL